MKGRGSLLLKCKDGNDGLLQEVYFILDLRSTIISRGQLSEEGNKVVMYGDYLTVYDKVGLLLIKVKRSPNHLYKIIIEESDSVCLLTRVEEVTMLWHSRLVHMNFQALSRLSNEEMAYGVPMFGQIKEIFGSFYIIVRKIVDFMFH